MKVKVNAKDAKRVLTTIFENRDVVLNPGAFAEALAKFIVRMSEFGVSTPNAQQAEAWYQENMDYVYRLRGGRFPHA